MILLHFLMQKNIQHKKFNSFYIVLINGLGDKYSINPLSLNNK